MIASRCRDNKGAQAPVPDDFPASASADLAAFNRIILITLLAGSFLIAVGSALSGQDHPTTILAAVNTLCYAILLVALPAIGANAAILGATVCLLVSVLYAMAVGHGLNDVAIVILPAVTIVGSLLLKRLQFLLVSLAMIVAVLAIGIAQARGRLAPGTSAALDVVDVLTPPIVLGASSLLCALLVDALRKSIARATESERSYREIFNATHEAIFIHEASSGRIIDVNNTMLAMYGYTHAEALQMTIGDLSSKEPEFSQERAMALLSRAAREGPQVFDWRARRKEGVEFWVEITLRNATIGKSRRTLAVVRNVNDRKRIEEQLRHSEKMQVIGKLAGGIAHDFNNQLTGMMGYVDLLLAKKDNAAEVERYATGLLNATMHARDLTSKLLTFARRGQQRHILVDLHATIIEVEGLLKRSIDPRIEIRLDLGARRTATIGDPAQLEAAFLNLGLNARDAMPEGGVLTLRTRDVDVERAIREWYGDVEPGTYLELQVTDTGQGIDVVTRKMIFEPFFTTKSQGTGMGLATVYSTIESHHGAIDVASTPGRGSTFRIWLPAISSDGVAHAEIAPALASLPGLRVLVAEDEPIVAAATIEMLVSLGCRVTHREDGQAALAIFRASPGDFDVVILDIVMPRLSGAETLLAIRAIRRDAVIILISGYEADANVTRLLDQGAAAFLKKPFRLAELDEIIRRVAGKKPQ
jgi:two-component system cell cycle sensor histidine kinase/response regulator CckA